MSLIPYSLDVSNLTLTMDVIFRVKSEHHRGSIPAASVEQEEC